MKPKPLVSVVIPAYNRQAYIAEAIGSVLEDSYRPVQIIVVDDGSTDGTADVIHEFSPFVKYIYQPNAGPAVARNTAVADAKGDYLAFLDSDDVWVNQKLQRQMNAFEEDPELQAVFGYVEQFYSPELNLENEDLPKLLPGYTLGAMAIRTEAFWTVGAFRADFRLADTVEWLSRLFEMRAKTLMLQEVILRRRIHGGNIGISKQNERIEYVRAMKSLLDRKRNKL